MGQNFQYDGLGRMTQSQDIISGGTTATNNYYYDSLGRQLEDSASISDLATNGNVATARESRSNVGAS